MIYIMIAINFSLLETIARNNGVKISGNFFVDLPIILGRMALDPLIHLIDQYDINPGNGIAEEVETPSIDEGFVVGLENLIFESGHSETKYFATLDLYLDWEGMEKVYDDLHHPYSSSFNPILCRDSSPSPAGLQAVPLIETEHADRVLKAINNIALVDPILADSLTDLLYEGQIVFVEDTADRPAFVDPRNGNIVIYESLFMEDTYRSQPFVDNEIESLFRFLEGVRERSDLHFSGSAAGLDLLREAQRAGLGYKLYVEEVLAHEIYHAYQLGTLQNVSDDDQRAQDEISDAGLAYSTLAYLDLFSMALEEYGYLPNVGAFGALTQDEYDSNREELAPFVAGAHDFTEARAQAFAGQIVVRISAEQKNKPHPL